MIRILLADDHAAVRKGPRYVVILDIAMPGRGGLDVLLPNGLHHISKMMSRGLRTRGCPTGNCRFSS